ncbi:MAG: threonine/serine exporter family protein [Anaerovoracaceae bacterium]
MNWTIFLGFIPVLAIAVLFRAPARLLPSIMIVGATSWALFQYMIMINISIVFSAFCSALLVGILGRIFSRVFKDAATLYTIPGIMPLVPGAGMYYTMLYLTRGNFEVAMSKGMTTIFQAGAIALALLLVASVAYAITRIKTHFSK